MIKSDYTKYNLQFKFPAVTSRGTLQNKETWFVKIFDDANPSKFGIGECALFRGLSIEDSPDYEKKLKDICLNINDQAYLNKELISLPSIKFGIETAILDFQHGATRTLFPSNFTNSLAGIPINGLIWMGTLDFIKQQVREKLNIGFRCLKFKIGALNIEDELQIIRLLRGEFDPKVLEIRLDANGAFSYSEVLKILERFSKYVIHSVEQPIKAGSPELISELCKLSPIPVALDEELIGKNTLSEKRTLLNFVMPQYIIIKPSLTGGFSSSLEWISESNALNIGWWITSALESNIGLNAIAQWTYSMNVKVTQGLGTGGLYINNIPSPLFIKNQELHINKDLNWDLSGIDFYEQ